MQWFDLECDADFTSGVLELLRGETLCLFACVDQRHSLGTEIQLAVIARSTCLRDLSNHLKHSELRRQETKMPWCSARRTAKTLATRDKILQVLQRSSNNRTLAARLRLLGVSRRRTLHNRLAEFGIMVESAEG